MALNPGEQLSGGNVVDADGRIVVIFDTPVQPTVQTAGDGIADADGRLVVVVERAVTS